MSDPVLSHSGALFLSLVIIVVWSRTATACFKLLAGSAAPMEFQNLVVYNAMLFSDSIEKIDSCIVYHSGPNYIVEGEFFAFTIDMNEFWCSPTERGRERRTDPNSFPQWTSSWPPTRRSGKRTTCPRPCKTSSRRCPPSTEVRRLSLSLTFAGAEADLFHLSLRARRPRDFSQA